MEHFLKKSREWLYLIAAVLLMVGLGWYALSSIFALASVVRSALGFSDSFEPLPTTFDFATVDQVLGPSVEPVKPPVVFTSTSTTP